MCAISQGLQPMGHLLHRCEVLAALQLHPIYLLLYAQAPLRWKADAILT